FCQIDAAGSERDLGAVDEFNLAAAAQRDDVLAAGCDVPISHTAWRCTTNLEPRTRLQLKGISAACSERDRDFLDMRQAVRSREKPVHRIRLAGLRRGGTLQILNGVSHNRHTQQSIADEPRMRRFHGILPCNLTPMLTQFVLDGRMSPGRLLS